MLETLASFSLLEWVGLLTGIVYVVLSAQNNVTCWYFGIVSCACIAYHDFFGGLKLYSDGVLQLFYIVMGVIGLVRWKDVSISFKANVKVHIIAALLGSLVAFFYGWIMATYSDASFPMVDAFTTVFSVIATLFLVNRMLSAWLYFIVIDAVMTYLYFVRGWELYAVLYLIFTVVAIYAARKWRNLSRLSLNNSAGLN